MSNTYTPGARRVLAPATRRAGWEAITTITPDEGRGESWTQTCAHVHKTEELALACSEKYADGCAAEEARVAMGKALAADAERRERENRQYPDVWLNATFSHTDVRRLIDELVRAVSEADKDKDITLNLHVNPGAPDSEDRWRAPWASITAVPFGFGTSGAVVARRALEVE
jgi:hypothetical protein